MDPLSALHATIGIIKTVDQYTASIEDAEDSFKYLKVKLETTCGLLTSLDNLIKNDRGDSYHTGSHSSSLREAATDSSRCGSVIRLIDDKGQMLQLKQTLDEISGWLNTLELKSKSRIDHFLRIRRLLSKEHQKKTKEFSDELESFESAANLVISIDSRYESSTVREF